MVSHFPVVILLLLLAFGNVAIIEGKLGSRQCVSRWGQVEPRPHNVSSNLTLFLEKGAIILGSQVPSLWYIVEPLPSYGRGIELPGKQYRSLINGYKLHDIVITDDKRNR